VDASAPELRSGTLEQRFLGGTFAELCRIQSPSGSERACAERVIAELRALDVDVAEDDAARLVGGDCGNLLARIPRGGERAGGESAGDGEPAAAGESASVLLCAHLDTVPLAAAVDPVVVDGFFENANDGILGADNKAAIAVLLALARRVRRDGAPVDVELLFTVGEETALAGARAFDASRLRSDVGYVFDHASPIGEVIVASPTQYRIDVRLRGAATHAGVRPEEGRSAILAAARAIAAMPHGRLDEQTTVNVGTIAGGRATNVVPDLCSFSAETRSLDRGRAEAVVAEIVDRVHEAANMPDGDCDVDIAVERMFDGYTHTGSAPAIAVAEAALRACGHEPRRIASGGGSDANALLAKGLTTVNLANGTERNHEPDERVSVAALAEMLDVAQALLDNAATIAPVVAR
jgi:tripeptide aminopeptidase